MARNLASDDRPPGLEDYGSVRAAPFMTTRNPILPVQCPVSVAGPRRRVPLLNPSLLAAGLVVALLLLAALLFVEQERLVSAIANARAADSAYRYAQLERELLKAALACHGEGLDSLRQQNLLERAETAIAGQSFSLLGPDSTRILRELVEALRAEPAAGWPCRRFAAWAEKVHPVVIEATAISDRLRADLLGQLRTYRRDILLGFLVVLLFALTYLFRQWREAQAQRRRIASLESEGSFKTRLIGMVAHELRTPIATILGFSELLSRPGGDRARYLARIQGAARRLNQTLATFLDLHRLESGRALEPQKAPVRLDALAREALDMVRFQFPDQRFVPELSEEPVWVEGDEARLLSTLLNLLTNAAKYGPAGDAVRLTLRAEGDRVRVEVHDAGPPLDAEEAEAVFRPWVRLSRHRGREGYGLGLSVAREVIAQHGGRIGWEARPPGQVFWFELPRLEV